MALGVTDLKKGQVFQLDGVPYRVIEYAQKVMGRGGSIVNVKIKSLLDGKVLDKTFKGSESIESADVSNKNVQYLYNDGEFWHFMQQESFEQVQANAAGVGDAAKWIKGEESCVVTLWNGAPIAVQPPNFVELQIVETDPGVRGDTSGSGGKPAKLETGAVVRVPLFVAQDEKIKVDTRTGEYVSRVK